MMYYRMDQYILCCNSIISLGSSRVDQLSTVFHHLLDKTCLLKFIQGFASQRAADLETLRDDSGGDQFVGRNFLQFHMLVKVPH